METTVSQIINGKEYTARRIIKGKCKIRQRLIFMEHVEHDSVTYHPDQRDSMDSMARLILWQLVTKGWLGQPPLESDAPPATNP